MALQDHVSHVYEFSSPIGPITLGSDGRNLLGLWMDSQKYFPEFLDNNPHLVTGDEALGQAPVLNESAQWLTRYFENPSVDPGPLPSFEFHGTAFQNEVWEELAKIPYGELVTYGSIAQTLAKRRGGKMSSRAVGVAVGRNPISIIVPCHRVVGASGSLTGYGGGIKRKVYLLTHEGVDMDKLTVPTKGTAL